MSSFITNKANVFYGVWCGTEVIRSFSVPGSHGLV